MVLILEAFQLHAQYDFKISVVRLGSHFTNFPVRS